MTEPQQKPLAKRILDQVFWSHLSTYKTITIALLIALMIRTTLLGNYKVPTGSMIPTILIGDHLFASHISYSIKLPIPFTNINLFNYAQPERGDIVVFDSPDPQNPSITMVKRVVAVPGDVLEIRNRKDVFINGERLALTFIKSEWDMEEGLGGFARIPYVYFREQLGTVEHTIRHQDIPRGFLTPLEERFLFKGSIVIPEDQFFVMGDNRDNSRDSRFWGFVPFDNIKGKAKIVWLSWNSLAAKLAEKIRIERLFKLLK
jgi:signal peptidase I